MKLLYTLFFALFFLLTGTETVCAQDVRITIPGTSIFNRSEFVTVQNVMNSQGNKSWRVGGIDPKIRSDSGENFKHTSSGDFKLPTSVLQWQLAKIGNQTPPFDSGDVLPGYKWFTNSFQTWYQPSSGSRYNQGEINFSFRVPSLQIESNTFHAGQYKLEVVQDYGRSGWYAIQFSPDNFNVFISIPEEIKWISGADSKNVTINSLNDFRSGSQLSVNLGTMEVGHTVDFTLAAKSKKKDFTFKPLDGKGEKFTISTVKLGSSNPKINSKLITEKFNNHSAEGAFKVERGNRSVFDLNLTISSEDFKNDFFEAGTYAFQIVLDAKSANKVNSEKEIEVTLVVPALSEISVPGGNSEVNFTFNTMQQYNEGQSKTIPNQLRVSNNEKYELYVKSAANYFNSNGVQSTLNSSILQISVEGNTQKQTLTTTPKKLIDKGNPAIDKNLNVIYTISPESAQSLVQQQKKTYGINIIYSFTAL